MADLKKEFQYYLDHQAELVSKYNGRVLVIKGEQVIGVYDNDLEALEETQKEYELGTFLIQKCSEGSDDYTVTFHSRVGIPYATV